MDLNYSVIPTFGKVHQDKNKYLFIRGPVGSGKSSGCIWHCVLNSFKQHVWYNNTRFARYGIIRASYPALKSTVIQSWKNWFKMLVNIVYDTPIRGEMILNHPDGETQVRIELVFIALDREEDVNKLQSLELTGAHVNETAEIPRGVHQMLKSRINRFPQEPGVPWLKAVDPFIICDYNSVDTEHWLYRIAEEEQPPKHSFYHQPSALMMVDANEGDPKNPIIDASGNHYILNREADNVNNLDIDYYPDIVLGADPDWVNVMILNNYGQLRLGRPVYPEYRDEVHFKEKDFNPIKGVKIIVGMDLGLTPAAAFMQLTPTGNLMIFDELVTEECSIEKFCKDYLRPKLINEYHEFNYELIIDPAATQRSQNDMQAAKDIIKKAGLYYRTAPSNNPTRRREAVVYFLRKLDGFILGPRCRFLRKGFISEYKYEKKRVALTAANSDPQFKEKPEKNIYSHIHDALQYGALEASQGRTVRRRRLYRPQEQDYTSPADNAAGY
ncbi:MAG: hypothetical protein GWN00_30945 [Aliifodinibius sp.]|nr:hypothetical protein [Fodinibius sp.]NIV15196.1 hypothetical protein [Fodinibius sp.]NIY29045.1 hypothetical protein [Fodinibius sp.]